MPLFVTVTPGTTVTSATTLDAATLNLLGTPSVDVRGTVDGGSLSIAPGSVPLTSLAAQNANTLVGNASGSSSSPTAITSTDLSITSGTVNIAANAVVESKIAARAVTSAKMFAVDGTTTAKLLGRYTPGSGDVETLTVGSNLTVTGNTLTTLRPRTAFTNVEAASTYTVPNVRANAVEITPLTTQITPQTNTSKVLVQFNFSGEIVYTSAFILERVDGANVTPLGVPATPGSRIYGTRVAPYDGETSSTQFNIAIAFLDSPASTNAITYRIRAYSSINTTLGLNRSITDTDNTSFSRSTSQVILQEILPS